MTVYLLGIDGAFNEKERDLDVSQLSIHNHVSQVDALSRFSGNRCGDAQRLVYKEKGI